jgi:hypothetical protein
MPRGASSRTCCSQPLHRAGPRLVGTPTATPRRSPDRSLPAVSFVGWRRGWSGRSNTGRSPFTGPRLGAASATPRGVGCAPTDPDEVRLRHRASRHNAGYGAEGKALPPASTRRRGRGPPLPAEPEVGIDAPVWVQFGLVAGVSAAAGVGRAVGGGVPATAAGMPALQHEVRTRQPAAFRTRARSRAVRCPAGSKMPRSSSSSASSPGRWRSQRQYAWVGIAGRPGSSSGYPP